MQRRHRDAPPKARSAPGIAWWQTKYGTVQAGAQYEYIDRTAFAGLGATKGTTTTPNTNENIFLVSLRFLPFN